MTLLFKVSAILFFVLMLIGMFVIDALENKQSTFKWFKLNFNKKKSYVIIGIFTFILILSSVTMVLTFDDLNDKDLKTIMEVKVKYDSNDKLDNIELERISGTDFLSEMSYYKMILEVETIDYKVYMDVKNDLLNNDLGSKVKLYLRIKGETNLIELNEVISN